MEELSMKLKIKLLNFIINRFDLYSLFEQQLFHLIDGLCKEEPDMLTDEYLSLYVNVLQNRLIINNNGLYSDNLIDNLVRPKCMPKYLFNYVTGNLLNILFWHFGIDCDGDLIYYTQFGNVKAWMRYPYVTSN